VNPQKPTRKRPLTGTVLTSGRLVSDQGVIADKGGVVLAEFVIAVVPILMLFFGICQISVLAYIDLLVKHAAFVAARTEAVVHPQMGDSGSEADVKAGVMELLGAIPTVTAANVTVDTTTLAGQYEENIDTITVKLAYVCTVPLADHFVCPGGLFLLKGTASFPNQGSSYQQIWTGS
jgi:Flp pilus assembly protein TadG